MSETTALTIAGGPSPLLQVPKGSLVESQQQIEQTENAIEGFNHLYPPGSLGGEFAGPGSTTNRPGQ
jgi:hypothetical protein